MIANRGPLRFDEGATVHMFTGFAPPGGTIGCAYVASFCNSDYTYGVEYMSFSKNPYSQGVGKSSEGSRITTCASLSTHFIVPNAVFAHEVAHILSAAHLSAPFLNRYIMEPNINNATGGFDITSVRHIMSFLNSNGITCDGHTDQIESYVAEKPTSRPTLRPTPSSRATPQPVPASNGKCFLFQNQVEAPTCIYASTGGNRYACFGKTALLGARASSPCLFSSPRARVLRCAGPLRTGFLTGSSSVRTQSCSASCIVTAGSVCFLATRREQAYSISFLAVADEDVSKIFSREVLVKTNDGTDTTCVPATTICTPSG
jgi:Metallo-peptidase family M12B Reprolysin-like